MKSFNWYIYHLSMLNDTDFPVSVELISKMCSKININPSDIILDPCVRRGEILNFLSDNYNIHKSNLYGICSDKMAVELCHRFGFINVIYGEFGTTEVENEKLFKQLGIMKFDKIIMNPPYKKNLHLKILNEAIKHANEIVSLQPTRWIDDPMAEYKKSSDIKRYNNICKHISNVEKITAKEANKQFNIGLSCNLGIYTLNTNNIYQSKFISDLDVRLAKFVSNSTIVFEKDKKDGYRVRIPSICSGKSGGSGNRKKTEITLGNLFVFLDGVKDGKKWHEFYGKNQHSKLTDTITNSIKFNTEIEAINFIKQQQTNFNRYFLNTFVTDVRIDKYSIPYMGGAINPRTGLKGYEGEWLDEDFYQYFNLTDEEINMVEDKINEIGKGN